MLELPSWRSNDHRWSTPVQDVLAMVTVDAPTVLIVRRNSTDAAEVAVLRLALAHEQGLCVASLVICHKSSEDGEQYPAVIRHRTRHKIVRFLAPRFRVSARVERNRTSFCCISINGSLESIQTSPVAPWTVSRLTGSPGAKVVGRFISAEAGFGYSGKGKWPSFLPRDGAAPVLFLVWPYLCTTGLGNRAFHLHPLSRDCCLQPLELWAVPDNVGDVAFVLKASRNAGIVLYSTGDGTVTVNKQGCFGLVGAEALVFLRCTMT